ncbi:hypothetical protein FKM82_005512 [Ascaphus truei]
MNEAKQTLKILDQRYKLLKQQQVTLITALDRTRENAHDQIKPVKTLAQVRNYLDNYCNNTTDKRILSMFLDICTDLNDYCVKLDGLQTDMRTAGGTLDESTYLLSPNNDLSGLRAKYPHDVVNHLSCDEAKNFYGGVVSLIPIVLDIIREAVYKMEKPQPHIQQLTDRAGQKNQSGAKAGENVSLTTGTQTRVSQLGSSHQQHISKSKNKGSLESLKPAWRSTGRLYTS